MKEYKPTYRAYGDNALLVEWPQQIEEDILYDVISLQKAVEAQLSEVVLECIPAYQSLTLCFDPSRIQLKNLEARVKELYELEGRQEALMPKLWKIPVCYDASFGVDQEQIALHCNLPIEDIIEIHFKTVYTVYFIGFLPGFLYLGGLSPLLHIPRKSSPSPKIMKGAVAIGGNQTGIYPQENPGGWHVIGNSPLSFMEAKNDPPVQINAGDKIRFCPISLEEHQKISTEFKAGTYKLQMEFYHE